MTKYRQRPIELNSLASLAHERACEGQLAGILEQDLKTDRLPDMAALRARFAPDPARLPEVYVQLVPLSLYETLTPAHVGEAA